jgi:hypothetical protein
MKKVEAQLKSMEKQKGDREKQEIVPSSITGSQGVSES